MVQTLTFNDVVKLINIEKAKGKKTAQIKILQYEKIKDKKYPKMILQTLGTADVERALKENGYTVEYTKTDRQASSKIIKNQTVVKVRQLYTTNMIVKW